MSLVFFQIHSWKMKNSAERPENMWYACKLIAMSSGLVAGFCIEVAHYVAFMSSCYSQIKYL